MSRYKQRDIKIVSPASQVGVAAPAILFRLNWLVGWKQRRADETPALLLLSRKLLDDRREYCLKYVNVFR